MSDDDDVVRSDEPIDRLTRLTDEMTAVLARPENTDVRAIVFLNDDERGGIQVYGYSDSSEAMAELFVHMKMVFKTMGADLDFIGIPESPEGLNVVTATWYLAVCVQCNGNLRDMIDHPEQFMPMPFDDKALRAEWADAHMEGTGHSVLLMNQHDRTTNDTTTHDVRHSDDKEFTVQQTE